MDIGATWLSCVVPLPDGTLREVLLSGPSPEIHLANNVYLGATIGRYANRIRDARIEHGGQRFALTPNAGSRHQLHGGPDGFNRRKWAIASRDSDRAIFTLDSADGDQGFPGALRVVLCLHLAGDGVIEMRVLARVSAPCPVTITNHAYFNLDARHDDARAQTLMLRAQRMLPVDDELIPLGHLLPVEATGFDFTRPRRVSSEWLQDEQQRSAGGYDHAWLLDERCAQGQLEHPALTLESADRRLAMDIATTLPSIQFYSGQALSAEIGRDGNPMPPYAGLALEPQFLPDSPNHPEWPQPSCWLLPGQAYQHTTRYRFRAM